MSDTKINLYVSRGSAAERAAHVPDPPTALGADPDHGYFWYETDTGDTYAWDGSAWDKIAENPANVGDVIGPGSAVDDRIATFDGTTGKLIQDGGQTIAQVLAAGVQDFTDLGDVPAAYTGAALQFVRVNAGETALEFAAGGGGATDFTDLGDVPATYTGAAGRIVAVNATEDGLEFIPRGWTVLASGTIAAPTAAVTFTGLNLDNYSELKVYGRQLTASASGFRVVEVSVDNGATYYTTSGDYAYIDAAGVSTANTSMGGTGTASASARDMSVNIIGNVANGLPTSVVQGGLTNPRVFLASTSAIDALRITSSGGNLTGGSYVLLGRP